MSPYSCGGGVILSVPEKAYAATFDDISSSLHTTTASAYEAAGGFLRATIFDSAQDAFNGTVNFIRSFFGTRSTLTEEPATLTTDNKQIVTEPQFPPPDLKGAQGRAGEVLDLSAIKSQIIAELKSSGLVTNTTLEKPTVILRTVERIVGGITQSDLDAQANIINNKLLAQVADLKNLIATRSDQNFSAIALTQKIDTLNGTTLSNVSFSGSISGLTDASIPDNITASNYLPLVGGTIAGDLTITGTCTGCGGGGSGIPDWQKESNFGVLSLTPTTTIPIWAKAGIYASSTLTVNGPANFNSITATSTLNVAGLTTLGNASTSVLTVSGTASATNLIVSNQITIGTLTGLLKAVAGLVSVATAGIDYENPLTFVYPLRRAVNAISTAFGTTTANSFNQLQQFDANASTSQLTTTGNTYLATTGGNVGIGTTSPYAKLSVVGEVVASYFSATSTTATSTFAGGLNVASGGLLYDLSSLNVGIGTLAPARKFSVFNTSASPQLRVSYDASNYSELTVGATGDLRVSASGGDISFLDENFRVCAGGACPTDPTTLTGNGNLLAEGGVFSDSFNPATCPTGMIPVPATDGKHGFCVDKYEAKGATTSPPVTSVAAGTPIINITQYNARAACILAGKHLITEAEWLAIAHNIENVGWNWNGGVAGTNQMSDGHSDSAPASSLAADVTGNADDDPCVGTGQTCGTTVWDSQRRTYKLSNGEYLWDFGGNIWEWTDQINYSDYPVYNSAAAGYQACATTGDGVCGNVRTTNDQWYRGGVTTVTGFLRGGFWGDGVTSGAFALALNAAPTNVYTFVGFRCAR